MRRAFRSLNVDRSHEGHDGPPSVVGPREQKEAARHVGEASAPAVENQQVRDLLRRYSCPVAYHEVRTRFLGNIATLKLSTSPLNVAKGLWGGAFPEVESIQDLNGFIDTLINGLWNALTIHQKRGEPFRLVKVPVEPSVANLAQLALTRRQELDGSLRGCSTARTRSTYQRRRMSRSASLPR